MGCIAALKPDLRIKAGVACNSEQVLCRKIKRSGNNTYICTSYGRLHSGAYTDGEPVRFCVSVRLDMIVVQDGGE